MRSKKVDKKNVLKKGLYIIATPIGNLQDISNRAVQTLQEVDFIICENPKHSLKLLNNKGIKKKLVSLHDYNEEKIINKISKSIQSSVIALISDAGSPLISDPGYKLVKYFINNGLYVTTIPGPSSVISALQLSGLPINNFAFYGFVPKQESKKKQFFTKINNTDLTSILFVSANNLKNVIYSIVEYMGNREVSICKEITKLNEQVFKGKTSKILDLLKKDKIILKGELTLVISGSIKNKLKKENGEIKKIIVELLKKYNLTETVKIVHSLTGISKKTIYQTTIKVKND